LAPSATRHETYKSKLEGLKLAVVASVVVLKREAEPQEP